MAHSVNPYGDGRKQNSSGLALLVLIKNLSLLVYSGINTFPVWISVMPEAGSVYDYIKPF